MASLFFLAAAHFMGKLHPISYALSSKSRDAELMQ